MSVSDFFADMYPMLCLSLTMGVILSIYGLILCVLLKIRDLKLTCLNVNLAVSLGFVGYWGVHIHNASNSIDRVMYVALVSLMIIWGILCLLQPKMFIPTFDDELEKSNYCKMLQTEGRMILLASIALSFLYTL